MSESRVKSGFERLETGAGSVPFKEGDPGENAFLIEQGKIEISMRGKFDQKTVVNVLVRGDLLGEMALISGQNRMARATALSDTTLLVISRSEFERRINAMDPVMARVLKTLTQKLRVMSETHVEEMVKIR